MPLAHEKRSMQIQQFLEGLHTKIENVWDKIVDDYDLNEDLLEQYRMLFYMHLLHQFLSTFSKSVSVTFNYGKDAPLPTISYYDTTRMLMKATEEFAVTGEEAMALRARIASHLMGVITLAMEAPYSKQQFMEPEKVFFGKKTMDEVDFD